MSQLGEEPAVPGGEASSETAAKPRRMKRPPRVRVTALERQVYEMRNSTDPPMPWSQIARELGKDPRGVMKAFERAERKIPHEGELAPPRDGTLEADDPERFAEFVTEIVSGDGSRVNVSAIARRLDIPPDTAQAIATKLSTTYLSAKNTIREVKRDYLKQKWGVIAADALDSITPEKLESAGLRDLGILAGIATDKLLVLQGLPNQIIRTEHDRLKLGELAEALAEEMGRRGVSLGGRSIRQVVDVECTRVEADSRA